MKYRFLETFELAAMPALFLDFFNNYFSIYLLTLNRVSDILW